MSTEAPAGWYADPTGRGEFRYWDGASWTEHISNAGIQSVEPSGSQPAATAGDAAAEARESGAVGPPDAQPGTPATPRDPSAVATATVAPPVKVCPHCRTQSATTSQTCPNCGKKYVQRKKWPWVLGGIFLVMVIGFAGCVAVLATAVDELNKEQARHAITAAQFDAVQLGSTQQDVINQLGKQPEDAQNFVSEGILNESDIQSSCIYYNKKGGSFGDRYQFCFDGDSLQSKNAY